MKLVNILHTWYSGGIGGTETHILNLARHSDKRKFSHTVCFLQAGGIISKEIKESGVGVIDDIDSESNPLEYRVWVGRWHCWFSESELELVPEIEGGK